MTTAVLWTIALNGLLAVGGWLVARYVFRQPRGLPRFLASVVVGWAWLTIGMQGVGTLGLLARGPLSVWTFVLGLVGLSGRWLSPSERDEISTPWKREPWSWVEVASCGMVLWAVAMLLSPSLLNAVKVVSDGPIYHLYFAARWWKAGRLILVAAPFGENAATYFPSGGDLWFAWLMIGWSGDALAKVGQAPFVPICGLTSLALCRRLGAGRPAAFVAVSWSIASTPLLLFAFEPNVDMIFNAAYLLSVYFLVRHALDDDGLASLVLGGLAAGLALGTKAPAVVFIPPLLVVGVTVAGWRADSVAGKLFAAVLVGLVPFTVAGFWYARNAILTGNPLYPLHVEALGRVWLRGWYGPDVMRLSPYYIPRGSWQAFVDTLLAVLDPRLVPFWLAAVFGVWRVQATSRGAVDRMVWLVSGLAIANVALYWLVIPYRTQQRFFLQSLGLAAVPLARLFDRGAWWKWVGVGLLAVHSFTKQTWPFSADTPPWDLSSSVPNQIPALISLSGPWIQIASTLAIGASAFVASWGWLSYKAGWRSLAIAVAATVAHLAIAIFLFYPWEADARQRFYPRFPDYYRGWLAFDARCGPNGARVAYAGTDLPYYLMGVGLRNEVRYVNIDDHPGWLMHDYQRDAVASGKGPTTWDHPRPGWDRIHPDYKAWLANLRSEGIQLLVVTRANAQEGPHNVADPQGFTVERGWADAHPETFEPLYGDPERDPLFRLYRLRPPRT